MCRTYNDLNKDNKQLDIFSSNIRVLKKSVSDILKQSRWINILSFIITVFSFFSFVPT